MRVLPLTLILNVVSYRFYSLLHVYSSHNLTDHERALLLVRRCGPMQPDDWLVGMMTD